MLSIENFTVGYGKAIAVEDVSVRADTGEFVAIIGANGAGKTTLLNAVMGFLPTVSGSVRLHGDCLDELEAEQRVARGMVLVPERRDLFGGLSVQDHLLLGGYLQKRVDSARTLDYVYALLPKLHERRGQLAGTLSGGEQQMVAIGRALMTRARTILMDEPSIGLAPIIVQQIFNGIAQLKRDGITAVIVEQNARLALSVADRGYVMELGCIMAEGTSEQLLQDPRLGAAYLGDETA